MLPTRGAFGPGRGPPGFAPVDGAAGAAGAAGADAAGAAGAGRAGCAGFGALNVGVGTGADGAAGAAAAGAAGAAGAGAAGAAGAGAAGLGPGRGPPGFAADGDGAPGFAAGRAAGAAAPVSDLVSAPPADGNDSRRRRATGASTVDDADFTNSPCSLSVASSSLLVTPSSLANSCTRALPATALLTWRSSGIARYDLGLRPKRAHRKNFTVCSCLLLPVP